jgi:hypothetical protein
MRRVFLTLTALTATFSALCSEKIVYEADLSQYSGFSSWKTPGAPAVFLHSKTEGRSGPGSLVIEIGENCPVRASFVFLVRLRPDPGESPAAGKITQGKKYTATVFAKVENVSESGELKLTFQALDETGKQIWSARFPSLKKKVRELGSGWSELKLEFVVPSDDDWSRAAGINCVFGSHNVTAGKIYFDDIKITEE